MAERLGWMVIKATALDAARSRMDASGFTRSLTCSLIRLFIQQTVANKIKRWSVLIYSRLGCLNRGSGHFTVS